VTYELLPPRGLEMKSIEAIKPLASRLEAVTVTDNPMATLRASSIAYGQIANTLLKIEVIPNLSCRDRNLLALQSDVLGAHLLGHRGIFIITGDAPWNLENFKGVWEVNSIDLCKVVKGLSNGQVVIRGVITDLTNIVGLSVGGAIVLGRSAELSTYRKKVEVGFDYFITQITYDSEQIVRFYEEAEKDGNPVRKHVQIGVCPAATLKKFRSVSRMPGIQVPEKIEYRLENAKDYRSEMISTLLELIDDVKAKLNGYSLGFHIMPMGNDEIGLKLVEELTR
jgi:methylenetetrahydrofolate reductase (NADPH)